MAILLSEEKQRQGNKLDQESRKQGTFHYKKIMIMNVYKMNKIKCMHKTLSEIQRKTYRNTSVWENFNMPVLVYQYLYIKCIRMNKNI